MAEIIREYAVMIDSKDRNYKVYPNPFDYEVIFNPLPTTREEVNGQRIIHEAPNPVIHKELKNVCYVKLETVLMPFYNETKIVEDYNKDTDELEKIEIIETLKPITDKLYTVLSIGSNYSNDNLYSTNDVLSQSFATLYYKDKISNTHFTCSIDSGFIKFNKPKTIDKLSIHFMDQYGQTMECDHLDPRIESGMVCNCTEEYEQLDCFEHNIKHPLNPVFQNHLCFKIGCREYVL